MRESSWGKIINKQVTRWVGSRQIDMRAHGTQKTRTEATCSHKTNHQPCAKQDTNTQLMRKLISHVFTQDMTTWKHAANEYTSYVPHSTRYNTNARTLTQRDRTWSTSVQTPSRNRNSRHECRDPNTTLQHETRHADWESVQTLEAARSHETQAWREYQGSVTKPWITLDRSERTLTNRLLICYNLTFVWQVQIRSACKMCCYSPKNLIYELIILCKNILLWKKNFLKPLFARLTALRFLL